MRVFLLICIFQIICSQAAGQLDSLQKIINLHKQDTNHVNSLNLMGEELLQVDPDSSKNLALKSIYLAQKIPFNDGLAHAYYLLGTSFFNNQQEDSAILYLEKAQKINTGIKSDWIPNGYLNLSTIYTNKGFYKRALELSFEALDFYVNQNDSNGIMKVNNRIGIIYFVQKNYERALFYNQLYLKQAQQLSNVKSQAFALGNIGLIRMDQGDFAKARDAYINVFSILDTLKQECSKKQAALNLGNIYLHLNQYDSALLYLEIAYDGVEKCNSSLLTCYVLRDLGKTFAKLERFEEAEAKLLASYEIAEDNEWKKELIYATEALAELYEKNGNLTKALNFLKIKSKLDEEVFNTDMTEELTRLELNYNFEKERDSLEFQKQAELLQMNSRIEDQRRMQYVTIAGLILALLLGLVIFRSYKINQRANISLEEKNKVISATLNEREILLREIHHRVKNNLQVVSSLLNIQSKFLNDELAKKAVTEGRNRVQSMALVHEKLYQSEDLANIDVSEYLSQLSSTLFNSYNVSFGRVKFVSKIESMKLPVDVTIQLGLIVNELISNALKHAFLDEQSGKVRLSLHKSNERHELEVADNGVGMKSSEDFSKSYGYRIVQSIARGLDGSLELHFDKGTRFRLIF